MPCDKIQVIEDLPVSENQEINNKKEEKKAMSSTMVLRKMPDFKMDAFDSATGHFTSVSSEDYKNKWTVICFYPADFTFVCPTEIAAINARIGEIKKLGVEVLVISTDTKFSHKRFVETEPILKNLTLTIGSDANGEVSRKFGVMLEQEGVALRGRYIVNPDGIILAEEVLAPSVGRNVNELIRQLEAWQHSDKTGEVCPANWRKGKKTLPVSTEEENMTGNVGKYVTIEDILS